MPLGYKIFGLDPAGLTDAKRQAAVDPGPDRLQRGFRQETGAAAGGAAWPCPLRLHQYQFRMNPVGAISSRCVCFQRFRNLVAVDPLTGELLWVRHDIPPGSQVFGDDQYIFVLPPRAGESRSSASPQRPPARAPRPSSSGAGRRRRWANAACRRSPIPTCGRQRHERGRLDGNPGPSSATSAWPRWAAISSPGTPAARRTPPGGSPPWKQGPSWNLFDPWQQRAVWPDRAASVPARRWRWRAKRPSA